ncbi:MAG: alkaline phosphatase family protein [Oscillospiraceae bacterium]|jgi:predicted AlkP superfamily pyrophosphatase or phosphodiesterase|nr:alkaline phosphatase family protein [Oscillospiraceae bacterium]
MDHKVILILVDGMRPDALTLCGSKAVKKILKESTADLKAATVMPSVTLPCHMSLFFSVPPTRHGILTNLYVPQVRPIEGLCDVLSARGKKCAFFYDWGQLRDLCKPSSLHHSHFTKGDDYYDSCNINTARLIDYVKSDSPDFVFFYIGLTDAVGHASGWMTKDYLCAVNFAWNNIERVLEELPEDYTVVITSDHGGHDRTHGYDVPEDMEIPVIFRGPVFAAGREIGGVSILDIAPTVAKLLGVEADTDWEGRPLL